MPSSSLSSSSFSCLRVFVCFLRVRSCCCTSYDVIFLNGRTRIRRHTRRWRHMTLRSLRSLFRSLSRCLLVSLCTWTRYEGFGGVVACGQEWRVVRAHTGNKHSPAPPFSLVCTRSDCCAKSYDVVWIVWFCTQRTYWKQMDDSCRFEHCWDGCFASNDRSVP